MKYNVYLKDIKGYCFESDKTVTVKMTGPYLMKELTDDSVSET